MGVMAGIAFLLYVMQKQQAAAATPVVPTLTASVVTVPMDSATAAALNTTPSVTTNSPAVQNELNAGCMG